MARPDTLILFGSAARRRMTSSPTLIFLLRRRWRFITTSKDGVSSISPMDIVICWNTRSGDMFCCNDMEGVQISDPFPSFVRNYKVGVILWTEDVEMFACTYLQHGKLNSAGSSSSTKDHMVHSVCNNDFKT